MLLFLLVHCWITLTASTTSAFVNYHHLDLESPWGPSVGSMLLALTLFGVLDKTDFRLGMHTGELSSTLLHESNRPTIQTSLEAENVPRNGYPSTNSIRSCSRPGYKVIEKDCHWFQTIRSKLMSKLIVTWNRPSAREIINNKSTCS